MTDALALNDLRRRIHALMPDARTALAELVGFPSVADGEPGHVAACEDAAKWTVSAFAAAGVAEVALHETPDGSYAVLGANEFDEDAPTVLLYAHYDVQPAGDVSRWRSDPWRLIERAGRWYGRGSTDCKGGIVTHLTALRAFDKRFPCNVKIVIEGAEEQGSGGLEQLIRQSPDLVAADTILVLDAANVAARVPTITTALRGTVNVIVTVATLASGQHSGSAGGPTPDALLALIKLLSTLRDDRGNTTVDGLDASGVWDGAAYQPEQFRRDVGVLDGVQLLGDGTVADTLWSRPAVTVTGLDAPPARGSGNEIQPLARARINLRIPPSVTPHAAQAALIGHLHAAAPWGVKVDVEPESMSGGFQQAPTGIAYEVLRGALADAFHHQVVMAGQGGSIPLCATIAEICPDTEIMLIGIGEPGSLIHSANENVQPAEIERAALAEAVFLDRYAHSIRKQPIGAESEAT